MSKLHPTMHMCDSNSPRPCSLGQGRQVLVAWLNTRRPVRHDLPRVKWGQTGNRAFSLVEWWQSQRVQPKWWTRDVSGQFSATKLYLRFGCTYKDFIQLSDLMLPEASFFNFTGKLSKEIINKGNPWGETYGGEWPLNVCKPLYAVSIKFVNLKHAFLVLFFNVKWGFSGHKTNTYYSLIITNSYYITSTLTPTLWDRCYYPQLTDENEGQGHKTSKKHFWDVSSTYESHALILS